MGGVTFVTALSLFHLLRNSYHPEKCFFFEFLQEMGMHQELLYVDILKFTIKNPLERLHFLCLSRQLLWKKCSVSCIFQAIIVIVVIKIFEKYRLRSLVLETNF